MKDLNGTPETFKILVESMGEILQDLGPGDYFLNMTPKAQE
jgi:hypothetical protein